MTSRLRKLISSVVALSSVLAISIPGVAHGGSPTVHTAQHPSAHHRHHHHRHHHSRIPQHNGGDHDADNNGGPSDGDGNT